MSGWFGVNQLLEQSIATTSKFIHRILRPLENALTPTSRTRSHTVDNHRPSSLPVPQRERRIDARFAVKTPCLYGLVQEQRQEAPLISGKAHSLNISSEGILLLLDKKPHGGQLLTLHNPALQRQRGSSVFEVRWTTELPVGSKQPCYLVGCHLAFGRFPFFLIQRRHLDRDISSLSL